MNSQNPTDPPDAEPISEGEELRRLFHRLWSKAATGDRHYSKAEWKRLAELLARFGIRL
jgi:hypothetical protein